MTASPSQVVFLRDRFLAPGEIAAPAIPVTDSGYLLGDGVFATMRAYDGACFRPERHLAILARGADVMGIELPLAVGALAELADDAARRVAASDVYVRVTITRGPTLSIVARVMDVPSDADFTNGVAAVTVGPRRAPPACVDGTIKTTSYAPQLIAQREAHDRGAREGIQLAIDGAVAGGTMSNLFVVSRGALITPPLASGCRAGVTREAILEIAATAALTAREERLEPAALADADEVFVTSTRVECLPLAMIDDRPTRANLRADVGGARYPHTAALRAALRVLVRDEHAAQHAHAHAHGRAASA